MTFLDLLVAIGRGLMSIIDRFTIEAVIALLIVGVFATAYFMNPSAQKEGALIAAFAGAWGFYLGSSIASKRERDQVGESISLTRAVVRSQSADRLSARTAREDARPPAQPPADNHGG